MVMEFIHVSKIDAAIEIDTPIHSHSIHEPQPTEIKIGKNIADLIEDGATLQMGIGAIPISTEK